ncbi:MAG: GYDIA family GHMP kinase [Flavobacteriaceae bacterium]
MHQDYYSNGKLLLSGEYAILDGATGLAVPTKYGQSLTITATSSGVLQWTSFTEKNSVWFRGSFSLEDLTVISTTDDTISKTLVALLSEAKSQNSAFLENNNGLSVQTHLNFPRDWGLGSSSTLINNLAQWAKIDPYKLLWNAFGGSGYDIACAQHNTPIFYQMANGVPEVKEVLFDPPFKDAIHFVYLNQKQSSKEAITSYRKQHLDKQHLVTKISAFTKKIATTTSLSEFESFMEQHEELLSKTLGLPTIKSKLFKDFPGAIKSLGAWGGDFVMVTCAKENTDYFKSKGYKIIIPYIQMVHSSIA